MQQMGKKIILRHHVMARPRGPLSPIISDPWWVDSSVFPGGPATSLEMLLTPSEVLAPAGAQFIVAFLFLLLPVVCSGSRDTDTGNLARGCERLLIKPASYSNSRSMC